MLVSRNISKKAQATTWQILVGRVKLVWGWVGDGGAQKLSRWEPVLLPVPLITNSSEHIGAALLDHAAFCACMQFGNELLKLADMPFDIYESDNATANDTLYHGLMKNKSSAHLICMNHCNQNGENHVQRLANTLCYGAGVSKTNIINDLYCGSLFLRTQGHFLRLLLAARTVVASMVRLKKGPPPPAAVVHCQAVRAFYEEEYHFTTRIDMGFNTRCSKFAETLNTFFA
eukprot:3803629-Pyramimonas_sp.AAC.1